MKKQRRTKFEIANIMLNAIKETKTLGIAKTMLLQKSNLSPQGFKEYYERLLKADLIEEVFKSKKGKESKGRRLFLTGYGKEYVKKSNQIIINQENLNKNFKLNLDGISYC